jgi:hypothetical protein
MKKLMKIIGVKLVHVSSDESGGIIELTLAPKDIVKKKPLGIMDLAMGNIGDIAGEIGGMQQRETKIYMDFNEYLIEFRNQPLSEVWVEVTLEKLASDIVRGK